MDSPILLFASVAVIIVLALLLPRWIRRSSEARGVLAGRRFEEEQLRSILDALGTTVELQTEPDTARRLVDAAAGQEPRKFTILGDGVYGIRFLEADDAIARLVPTARGARLQIVEFREYLGRPNTAGFWTDLRTAVTEAASARGIAHETPAATSLFDRDDGHRPTWRLHV
ncbi:hypothetical protein [Microbacterium sp. 1.5R]|uniref:hypothetical protein n=1 Tax=Microbacterium sp. 1.5R TaxID=1916917 RepID=UPI0011AA6F84|nr:hypothetical protein [Microbacterium sp. 1.5R]